MEGKHLQYKQQTHTLILYDDSNRVKMYTEKLHRLHDKQFWVKTMYGFDFFFYNVRSSLHFIHHISYLDQ